MAEILLCCVAPVLLLVAGMVGASLGYAMGYEVGSEVGLRAGRHMHETGDAPTDAQIDDYRRKAAQDLGRRVARRINRSKHA